MLKEAFIYSHKQYLKPLVECLRQVGYCLYYIDFKNLSEKIPWVIVDSTTYFEIKDLELKTVLFYKRGDQNLDKALKFQHLYLLNEELDLYFQIKNLLPFLRDLNQSISENFQQSLQSLLSIQGLRSKKDFFQKLIDIFEQEPSIRSYGFYWKKTSKVLGSPFLSGLKLKHLPDIFSEDFHPHRITYSLLEKARSQVKDYFINPFIISLKGQEEVEILCFLEIDESFSQKALFLDSALNDFYKNFVLKNPHEFLFRN